MRVSSVKSLTASNRNGNAEMEVHDIFLRRTSALLHSNFINQEIGRSVSLKFMSQGNGRLNDAAKSVGK